ncbi:glycosyltransferase family 2 protein [Pelagibacterium sp.]|uniref:glycosyltransferase family 2 protein n=1 Tax=Pelagibacterium sp. TaxID=1967288 RepID=UPI003A948AC7
MSHPDFSASERPKNRTHSRQTSLKIAVIIASIGRPGNVATLLRILSQQSVLPSQVILSIEKDVDAPPQEQLPGLNVKYVLGPRGMTAQRNRGLERLSADTDIVIFYDDDFVPSTFALEGIGRFFLDHQEVAGATGVLLADGILGAGISPQAALEKVAKADRMQAEIRTDILAYRKALYGCNMAYRLSMIQGLRFDEALPLYGWLEDIDFGGQIQHPMAYTNAFTGVHCGEKRGRETSGKRLGYSQVCNPVYLWRKGTADKATMRKQILRNILANHVKLFFPEPWVDRKGRAIGNWIATFDLLCGKAHPGRILDL